MKRGGYTEADWWASRSRGIFLLFLALKGQEKNNKNHNFPNFLPSLFISISIETPPKQRLPRLRLPFPFATRYVLMFYCTARQKGGERTGCDIARGCAFCLSLVLSFAAALAAPSPHRRPTPFAEHSAPLPAPSLHCRCFRDIA